MLLAAIAMSATGSYTPNDSECGPRCVRFLLGFNDIEVTLESLIKQKEDYDRPGWSMGDVLDAIKEQGLNGRAVSYKKLIDLNNCCPSIVHLLGNEKYIGHFIVLLECDGRFAKIWDGNNGVSLVSSSALETQTSGHAIVLLDVDEAPAYTPQWPDMPYARYAFFALVMLLFAGVSGRYIHRTVVKNE